MNGRAYAPDVASRGVTRAIRLGDDARPGPASRVACRAGPARDGRDAGRGGPTSGVRTVTGARGESRAASLLHRPHHPSTQPSGRRAFRDGLRVRECRARGAGAYVTG
ncbi:hypothetical protein D0U02_03005 [Burkholderia pseudomallei]|nr:hypothetical protein BOC51_31080 [Burkholderia pseudomallei]AYX38516.1 hypothetical protein EGY15_26310 [Burkholderia pseudomallei]OND88713.1 hypothetical protein AQ942_18765 [Burkholderia pseudomallei]ONF37273.1 hypothetical protein AQ966_11800 [Burkholderia pseudomallei]RFS54165.1 hypothetical protein D0U05_17500 [Burkholderia pseudomallei]